MFEHLSKFNKIVVVGHQRSGTTIMSKMIADDLKYEPIDESYFHTKDANIFKNSILNGHITTPPVEHMVIQAPELTTQIQNLVTDDVLVVYVVRNREDIIKSLKKMRGDMCTQCGREYSFELNEYVRNKMQTKYAKHCISKKIDDDIVSKYKELTKSDKTIIDNIYSMWYGYQKDRIKNTIEIEYESLSSHHLWVSKEDRINFQRKQTFVGQCDGLKYPENCI